MYLTIRNYKGATNFDDIVNEVDTDLIPQFRETEGFNGYYLVDLGEGALASVTIFGTREQADTATNKVIGWVNENLQENLPNAPEITSGEVKLFAVGQAFKTTA